MSFLRRPNEGFGAGPEAGSESFPVSLVGPAGLVRPTETPPRAPRQPRPRKHDQTTSRVALSRAPQPGLAWNPAVGWIVPGSTPAAGQVGAVTAGDGSQSCLAASPGGEQARDQLESKTAGTRIGDRASDRADRHTSSHTERAPVPKPTPLTHPAPGSRLSSPEQSGRRRGPDHVVDVEDPCSGSRVWRRGEEGRASFLMQSPRPLRGGFSSRHRRLTQISDGRVSPALARPARAFSGADGEALKPRRRLNRCAQMRIRTIRTPSVRADRGLARGEGCRGGGSPACDGGIASPGRLVAGLARHRSSRGPISGKTRETGEPRAAGEIMVGRASLGVSPLPSTAASHIIPVVLASRRPTLRVSRGPGAGRSQHFSAVPALRVPEPPADPSASAEVRGCLGSMRSEGVDSLAPGPNLTASTDRGAGRGHPE
ncbi:unnamed protein product [Diplocarpon coronariae]